MGNITSSLSTSLGYSRIWTFLYVLFFLEESGRRATQLHVPFRMILVRADGGAGKDIDWHQKVFGCFPGSASTEMLVFVQKQRLAILSSLRVRFVDNLS